LKYLIPVLALLLFGSCDFIFPKEEEKAVARVGEKYLYEEDLALLSFESSEDSLQKIENFIDSWIKKELLLEKALQNLNENQSNFEEQLENYKNSLLIYAYESQLIRQKMDTAVRSNQIKSYYTSNSANFEAKESLYQLTFVKLLNTAPSQDSMNYWLFSDNEDYYEKLLEYCTQFAVTCHLDTSIWVSRTNLKDLVPVDVVNADELFIESGKNLFADSTHSLVMNVFKVKEKGETAPMSYVEDQIVSILRNQRRLQLISKVKAEIFEEATLNKKYEIY